MTKVVKLLSDFSKLLCTSKKGYDSWYPEKVRVISGGEGTSVCEVTVDHDMLDGNNTLHSGCIACLMDMAPSITIITSAEPFPGVSVDVNISYLSTAKLGDDIVITSKVLKTENNLAYYAVDLSRKSDGKLIAVGKQTQYIWMRGDDKARLENFVKNSLS